MQEPLKLHFLPTTPLQQRSTTKPEIPVPESFYSSQRDPFYQEIQKYFTKLFTICIEEHYSQATIYTEKQFWLSNNAKVYIGKAFLQAHGGLGTDFRLRITLPTCTNLLVKVKFIIGVAEIKL